MGYEFCFQESHPPSYSNFRNRERPQSQLDWWWGLGYGWREPGSADPSMTVHWSSRSKSLAPLCYGFGNCCLTRAVDPALHRASESPSHYKQHGNLAAIESIWAVVASCTRRNNGNFMLTTMVNKGKWGCGDSGWSETAHVSGIGMHWVCREECALPSFYEPCHAYSQISPGKMFWVSLCTGTRGSVKWWTKNTDSKQQRYVFNGAKVATIPVWHSILPSHQVGTICIVLGFIGLKILKEKTNWGQRGIAGSGQGWGRGLAGLTPDRVGWASRAASLFHLNTLGALFCTSGNPGFVQLTSCAAECSSSSRATCPKTILEVQRPQQYLWACLEVSAEQKGSHSSGLTQMHTSCGCFNCYLVRKACEFSWQSYMAKLVSIMCQQKRRDD